MFIFILLYFLRAWENEIENIWIENDEQSMKFLTHLDDKERGKWIKLILVKEGRIWSVGTCEVGGVRYDFQVNNKLVYVKA